MGFGTLVKMARGGGVGPDELAEMLGAMGMQVEIGRVTGPQARGAFDALARAVSSGGELVRITGAARGGDGIEALIVLVPRPAPEKRA